MIEDGVFSGENVALTIVGFEQDVLVLFSEALYTYDYLVGDEGVAGESAVTVWGESAIHDMCISEPQAVIDALGW